uniref:Telokin-like protein n=1 Tax=Lymantria dispar multicapsid nuclear polyhedrosis virus TaxID=10449 RepID=A0A1B1MQW7_NPVLD|nr:telokin-like protein [Lymantria dispar multiple nucleopolyhedrovirus]
MAANNSDTVNIAAYVTLDKEEFKHTLSFIVQDEYHLKKLTVGAYNINVLDTRLLDGLAEKICFAIVCGNYNVIYNFTQEKSLRVILFNASPVVLKKHSCIFKIVVPLLPSTANNKTPSLQPNTAASAILVNECVDKDHSEHRSSVSTEKSLDSLAQPPSAATNEDEDCSSDEDEESELAVLADAAAASRHHLPSSYVSTAISAASAADAAATDDNDDDDDDDLPTPNKKQRIDHV